MKKILRNFFLVLLGILVVMQFFRPAKNQSAEILATDISNHYAVPADVQSILSKSCYDCHSNNTQYPWYNNIQPVAWFLDNHVKDGKRHLNFSEFTAKKVAVQYKKMEECIEEIKKGDMPLAPYTWIHTDEKLTDEKKTRLHDWCETVRDAIKARYPADSLVLPKRKQ